MSEWIICTLGEVLEVKYGKDHKKLQDGKYPCFGSGGFMRSVDEYIYDEESILIPRKGSLNKISYQDKPFWTVDTMFWTKIDRQRVNPKYLFYQLTSTNFSTLNVGSAVPSLTVPVINGIKIKLPPLEEQKAIASVLSCLDAKIENLRRQNETLEAIAQTLFKHWFIDFEFPNEDGKPYKSSGGEMRSSELGEIPKDWQIRKLGDEIDVQKGLSYKGSGLADIETGIPMHNLKSIYEGGGYQHEGIKYYNADYKERHICKAGDIIVTNTEQGEKHKLIGFPARIPAYFENTSIFTHHISKISIQKSSYLRNEFIYYLFHSRIMRHQIISYTNGTTVNMLPNDGLKLPIFALPPKEMIAKFSEVIKPIWAKSEINYEQIQTLTKTRDALLPKLMSGQIRVKE
ncbi:restriction endonuclease subunit S [Cyanobacterium sp. DS4]|uniref:restriction endonuclease subunit S n=1 Tax=Cyanobacterium sp. DS4 TaxID=2878255 RepID=UPI002E81E2FB|nr:restriction endonuclease subunit S [Cyanobacterium sp. Dongsha4]WVL02530.1 restriction endonuclease subunit S [Cyanobacterium sp. Dongsha4]